MCPSLRLLKKNLIEIRREISTGIFVPGINDLQASLTLLHKQIRKKLMRNQGKGFYVFFNLLSSVEGKSTAICNGLREKIGTNSKNAQLYLIFVVSVEEIGGITTGTSLY